MKKLFSLMLQVAVAMAPGVVAFGSNPQLPHPAAAVSPAKLTPVIRYNGAQIQPGKLIFKVKPQYRSSCSPSAVNEPKLMDVLARIQSTALAKKFPTVRAPETALNRYGNKPVDLSLIYQVFVPAETDIREAIYLLESTGVVEYAEPLYVQEMCYHPSDPDTTQQYHIRKIQAYAAWDVWKGDTNTVIGIVDSGTDWDHPDLAANVAYNWNDPIDGLDNDSDGFIDNFRGWDVSMNDNDPMVASSDHGAAVSGDADEVTDNGVGGMGPAFKCRFLPVKCALDASTSTIDNGYDGIVYAADHGANVINMSWGRAGGPSSFEQDVINHAFYDHDVTICAAAGNNSADGDYYPASYDHVISVCATGTSDSKAGFSNYGYNVDVCAPGVNIYSTIYNNGYSGTGWSGTSMASPIAAGCAAMIKSRWPALHADQVAEQLRNTCDNIYSVSGNTAYQFKLGKGRVNMFRALTDSTSPGVVVDKIVKTDNNDNVFIANDTLHITATFKNLLRPTNNLVCTITSSSPYVQVITNSFPAGVINTMDTLSNYTLPFTALIRPTAPTNADITFRITMTDGSWSDFYAFHVIVNVDYINIDINDVAASITSKSLTGYNDSMQVQGIGLTYMGGGTLLYEMGLMVGASGTQVSDNVRGDGALYDHDFLPYVTVTGQNPGTYSDFDAYGVFKDNGSTSAAPMNLVVTHRAYAWIAPADRKYIIVEYTIHNNSGTTLSSLYAGIFADWDIPAYANDKCSVDSTRKMGYAWSTDAAGMWAGVKVLSRNGGFNQYAIDNLAGGGGGMDVTANGFTNALKYQALSTWRADGGNTTPTGNDILDVVSTGPFNLNAGDSVTVAFALIAGEDLSMLQASADAAQVRYDALNTGLNEVIARGAASLSPCFPNPANHETTISFTLKEPDHTELALYNALGEKVKILVSEKLTAGSYSMKLDVGSLPAGQYLYRLTSGSFSQAMPLNVTR